MNKVNWYEQVKENFPSVISNCCKGELLEMYEKGIFTVDFIECEDEYTIKISLAEQKTLIGILKYSKTSACFYMDYHVIPPINRRIIMNTVELLAEYIEQLVVRGIYNLVLSPNENIIPFQKIN